MKNLFLDTREMDKAARERYFITEDIMMENAASALEKVCLEELKNVTSPSLYRQSVLILCGAGNNGADGYALARRLMQEKYSVTVCKLIDPKTEAGILQKQRAEKIGVNIIELYDLDSFLEEKSLDLKLVVDCIFGIGFHGKLPLEIEAVIKEINNLDEVIKISCDIPSGLDQYGKIESAVFKSDVTVTMGSLKHCLFTSNAKDCAGKIVLTNLGISQDNFEAGFTADSILLEEEDLILPFRKKQNVNKGSFGHAAIVAGEKEGAAVIASEAAIRFGAGLVTVVSENKIQNLPFELMQNNLFPEKTSAVALGMGLGRENINTEKYLTWILENKNVSCVLDADIFYSQKILKFLEEKKNVVLTPHPKEFSALLENCGLGKFSVKEVVENQVEFMKQFCQKFPSVVLLVKGATVMIGINAGGKVNVYLNPYGTNALAKAGSGDVLSGIIAALLAQNYPPLKAACCGSLAHSLAAKKIVPDYSLTPFDLISKLSEL